MQYIVLYYFEFIFLVTTKSRFLSQSTINCIFASMLRIFLGNQLFALLLLPFILVGYVVLNSYMHNFEVLPSIELGLWGKHSFYNINALYYLTGGIVLMNAILANYLFNSNDFYDRNSYVISLFYIVFTSYFQSFYHLDGILLSHTFILFAIFQLFHLENNADGRKWSFNAGIFFGIAATLNPPLFILLPVIWLMITRIRPFVFREMLLSTLGFAVPIVYLIFYLFLNEDIILKNVFEINKLAIQNNWVIVISIVLFSFSSFLSLIAISYKTSKSSLRFKKLTAILKLLMSLSVLLGLVEYISLGHYELLSISMIALSFFLPFAFFTKSSSLVGKLLFYGTFVFSIVRFFI